jgi:anti-sigma28 factor (negative regulator of flagellin synthesis)
MHIDRIGDFEQYPSREERVDPRTNDGDSPDSKTDSVELSQARSDNGIYRKGDIIKTSRLEIVKKRIENGFYKSESFTLELVNRLLSSSTFLEDLDIPGAFHLR